MVKFARQMESVNKILVVYLSSINIIALALMFIDKQKAKSNSNRISENTLFFTAFIGGILGTMLGMVLFNHKTAKWSFKLVIGIIVLIQSGIIYYLLNR